MLCPFQPDECRENCALWMDYQCAIKAIAVATQCSVGALTLHQGVEADERKEAVL